MAKSPGLSGGAISALRWTRATGRAWRREFSRLLAIPPFAGRSARELAGSVKLNSRNKSPSTVGSCSWQGSPSDFAPALDRDNLVTRQLHVHRPVEHIHQHDYAIPFVHIDDSRDEAIESAARYAHLLADLVWVGGPRDCAFDLSGFKGIDESIWNKAQPFAAAKQRS